MNKRSTGRHTIKAEHNGRHGVVVSTLNTRCQWCVATNEPLNFESVKAARDFFFGPRADDVPPVGSCIWVSGPRGGVYPMRRVR
jgi:hypothetical protein